METEATSVSPFRSRNFGLLFGSTAASSIGDWLDFVAVLTLVSVIWKDGAFGLAAVSVAVGLPALLAPFVGVIVDRSSPRVVMVSSDVLRAMATLGMVFARDLWVLASLLAVRSLFSTAFAPAGQSIIKEAAGDSLVAANAAMQTVTQGFKVLGPAIGGLLLTVAAPSTVFMINSATFVVSALLLSGLTISMVERPVRTGYFAELGAGVRFVGGSQTLRLLLVAMGGTVFCVFLFDSIRVIQAIL
ncbi:MAG: MFS transporter [Pseudonocardiaceae bacterium]